MTRRERIDKRIELWAKDRGLNELKYNHYFAMASQHEEMAEELRARGNDDKHEIIDALCDQYVYATVDSLKDGTDEEYTNKVKEMVSKKCKDEFDIGIELFLNETLKEISSRIGAWSDEHGKWKKFTTPEAKALWYKADYIKIVDQKSSKNYFDIIAEHGDSIIFENKFDGSHNSTSDMEQVIFNKDDLDNSTSYSDGRHTVLVVDGHKYNILKTEMI